MSTITLPNIRVSSDLTVRVRLKDDDVAIDWSTLTNIKACIYSDAQMALAGRCSISIDAEDSTLLVCNYAANKPQYLGANRIVVSAKYMGETKTYDKPAFTFVRWTDDQAGEQISIDDPDVDVEIDVEDISSSILQAAVDAAFTAADRANDAAAAAEHMVDIHTGPEGKSAYEVAVDNGYQGTETEWLASLEGEDGDSAYEIAVEQGFVGTKAEWLASLKGDTGETPDITIGTVTTAEPGTPAAATMTGTPEDPVLNLTIPQGAVGATPNFTVGTVTTGAPGTSVVVTITGTAAAPVLNITIPQGMQGNTGSSVEYPYELVNNLTTNDATKGLSAAQGYVLDGKVSQLRQEMDEASADLDGINIEETWSTLSPNPTIYIFAVSGAGGKTLKMKVYNTGTGSTTIAIRSRDKDGNNIEYINNGVTIASGSATEMVYNAPSNFWMVEVATSSGRSTYKMTVLWDGGVKQDISKLSNDILSLNEQKVETKPGKNIYNPDNNTSGKYINTSGTLSDNINYFITDFISVSEGNYCLTAIDGTSEVALGSNSACFNLYDSNRQRVSTIQGDSKTVSIPSGVSYIRCSCRVSYTNVQIETGSVRTSYEPYSPLFGYPVSVPDGSVSYAKLDSALQDRIDNAGANVRFGRFNADATLAVSEFVKTERVYLDKDSLLSALIEGTIQKVEVGVGKTDGGYNYYGHWVEIDQTNVKLYWYNNSTNVLLATYTHGLTLTEKTTVVVDSKIELASKTTTIKIFTDDGQAFVQSLSRWGAGAGFVKNANTSGSLDVSVSLMPRQITKKIWLFGDSYFNFIENVRWPYYFAEMGMLNYFSNNLPGLSPSAAYSAIQSLLALGFIPSYVVWCLGMNGATTETKSGGDYVINSDQKQYIDAVVTLQQNYGFELVFGTVPTVPTRQKTGFCNYVRALGYRVIDFAEAVGADEYGIWHGKPTLRGWKNGADLVYTQMMGDGHALVAVNDNTFDAQGDITEYKVTAVGDSFSTITVNGVVYSRSADDDILGLLSSDGIHPSSLGAKVLASRAFADFPEMSIME